MIKQDIFQNLENQDCPEINNQEHKNKIIFQVEKSPIILSNLKQDNNIIKLPNEMKNGLKIDFENFDKIREVIDEDDQENKIQTFKCTFDACHKTYKSKENLKIHFINKHLKKKPFKCQLCDTFFSHRNGRIYHMRKKHTNFLPFLCPEKCGRAFASTSALRYHTKFQHSKEKEKIMINKILDHLEDDNRIINGSTNNHNNSISDNNIINN